MSSSLNSHCSWCGRQKDPYSREEEVSHGPESPLPTSTARDQDAPESSPGESPPSSPRGAIRPEPMGQYWYCGHCRNGPMSTHLQKSCRNCDRLIDIYAFDTPFFPIDESTLLPTSTDGDQLTQIQTEENHEQPTGSSVHAASPAYLQNPRAYYHKLRNLKNDVYKNSALALSLKSVEEGKPFPRPEAFTLHITDSRGDPANTQLYEDVHKPVIHSYETFRFDLNVYRNLILAAFSNIERLQRHGFIQNQLSILVFDPFRPSVADLLWAPIDGIKTLALMFDNAVRSTDHLIVLEVDLKLIAGALTVACDQLLSTVHLSARPPQASVVEYYSTQAECSRCWNDTVHLLDIAVLAYAGAHVDDFPKKTKVRVPEPLQGTNGFRISERIHLQRQSLKCLDLLLGAAQAWIFSLQPVSAQGGLYVSTSADVFADIWGPMWKVHNDSDRSIRQYNVGSGSIVPWAHETGEHPQLNVNERFGHWMPLGLTCSGSLGSEGVNPWLSTGNSSEDDQTDDQDSSESEPEGALGNLDADTTRRSCQWNAYAIAHPFHTNERLLIGANGSPKLAWSRCRCSTHRTTHQLKEKQQLHFLKTSRLFHYVDSRNLSMVAGSHGAGAGASMTLKTQNGRSWKEVVLETWENEPGARNPRTWESFWGVMISLCTFNARRVRLTELLGTDSIRHLLKPFPWSNSDIRNEFYKAITSSDPYALRGLWDREARWQEELGRALLTCLRALCQTGYDSNRKELNALWMSLKSTGPKRVVLEPREHSWVLMLQDSEDSFATAVMVKECLGITAEDEPQICRRESGWSYKSRLETAITINHEIRNSALEEAKMREEDLDLWRTADHRWKRRWDVSNVDQGEHFWIQCPPARLKSVRTLTPSHLLMEWDVVKRDKLRETFGLELDGTRPGHWEYTDVEDQPPVRPIPVHIL